jgi:aminopeptidase N
MSIIPRVLFFLSLLCCTAVLPLLAAGPAEPVHHDLKVTINPAGQIIEGTDRITFPSTVLQGKEDIRFVIHKGMEVACLTEGLALFKVAADAGCPAHMESFGLRAAQGGVLPDEITLSMKGVIHHSLEQTGTEYARSFSETPGIICDDGVFLSAGSGWYPSFDVASTVSFDLQVVLPAGWDAVSQGVRTAHDRGEKGTIVSWTCPLPQEDIYITAGRYSEYSSKFGDITAYAFLRSDDAALAAKYLEATEKYITMYSEMIGPYPYKKFALVENFWETGYGMPSFTLLGSTVIRFPFILTSSYPHEILHNWWGNGVFVEWESGNWCEGLTAYLADHMIKEQQGRGAAHRRATLQKYTDYVQLGEDFPLTMFRSRHDAESEAVGYGKCLMFFHMLRLKLGDEAFIEGLREFYKKNLFRSASFADVAAAFSAVSGKDLKGFFGQWVEKTGAVWLGIWDGGTHPLADGSGSYHVDVVFDQRQEDIFDILVPIAVFVEGKKEAFLFNIETKHKRSHAGVDVPGRPLRIEVDPRYEVFRRLEPGEIPPSIGRVFGAQKVLIVLPGAAEETDKAAWEKLAALWGGDNETVEVLWDDDDKLKELPENASVWVFGRLNRFSPTQEQALLKKELLKQDVEFIKEGVRIGKNSFPLRDRAFVLTSVNPKNNSNVICWVGADDSKAIPGLGRKLPHYGKYSFLVFEGNEPTNIAKGQWPSLENPMGRNFAKEGVSGATIPVRKALVDPPAVFSAKTMKKHVLFLADEKLAGRGLGTPGLEKAAAYIAGVFRECGLEPAGVGHSYFQEWTDHDLPGEKSAQVKNVMARIAGTDPSLPAVVVGAHYDHLGLGWPDVRSGNEGKIHPGADDNASGVSVLLEVARVLGSGFKPKREIVFVAFTGEEAGLRGSLRFVSELGPVPTERVFAMINLDSVGRLGERKLQVFGTGSTREWIHIIMGAGYTTGVEADSIARDSGGSDQLSFLTAGIPAIHVFAGMHPDYHAPGDTTDKVDFKGMVKAALLVREAVVYLADREEPLTVTLANATSGKPRPKTTTGSRRASLGTMPDFAFKGEGVRVGAVMPGSAAEKAGLCKGDVIRKINDQEVTDLKSFSTLLKALSPGDEVTVHYVRGDEKAASVKAVLQQR